MSQIWLTCEEPEELVKKYREYVFPHGDPGKKRRVVLDEDTLPRIKQEGNSTIQVVPREALLERFMKTLEEQANLASVHREHFIVLIFGHGDADGYDGVYYNGGKEGPEDDAPRLHMGHVKRILSTGVDVTLFMTSCYSGGWLVEPKTNSRNSINAMGVTEKDEEARSWSGSRSIKRAYRSSTIASAILQLVANIEEEGEEEQDVREHPIYRDLASSIFEAVKKINTMASAQGQGIHFSIQNDEWETYYQPRTGPPLTSFKERWEPLREIAPSDTESAGIDGDGDGAPVSSLKPPSRTRRELQHRAKEYLSSHPGPDNLSLKLSLHQRLRGFLNGTRQFTDEQIQQLLDTVIYRLTTLQEADEYVEVLGIEMPSSKVYAVEMWQPNEQESQDRDKALRYPRQVRLFDRPPPGLGLQYPKPFHFLAVALVQLGRGFEGVVERVSKALLGAR